jgi:protein arginine kinase
MSEKEAFELDTKLCEVLSSLLPESVFLHSEELESEEILRLYARRLISQNFVKQGRSFGYARDGSWSIMLLEDDHIRLQSCEMGYRIPTMFDTLVPLLRNIEQHVDFAFDEKLGYLTSSLLNVGTGMRMSALLNLWGLKHTKNINPIMEYANNISYMIINFINDDSDCPLYYCFNYYSLGMSEQEMLTEFEEFLKRIWLMEEEAREKIFSNDEEALHYYLELQDITKYNSLSYEEMLSALCTIDVFEQRAIIDLGKKDSLRMLAFTYSEDMMTYDYQIDQEDGDHLRWREMIKILHRIRLKPILSRRGARI